MRPSHQNLWLVRSRHPLLHPPPDDTCPYTRHNHTHSDHRRPTARPPPAPPSTAARAATLGTTSHTRAARCSGGASSPLSIVTASTPPLPGLVLAILRMCDLAPALSLQQASVRPARFTSAQAVPLVRSAGDAPPSLFLLVLAVPLLSTAAAVLPSPTSSRRRPFRCCQLSRRRSLPSGLFALAAPLLPAAAAVLPSPAWPCWTCRCGRPPL